MTLKDRWNDLKYAPGHIEAIMIEDLVKEVDSLRSEVNALREAIQELVKINRELEKRVEKLEGPMHGPMIDDEEE